MPNPTGKVPRSVPNWTRVHRVGKVLPATGQAAILTILGGAVRARLVMGRCTKDCDATATTLKVTANPTIGTDVDLCTAVAITSKVKGSLVNVSGSALSVAQAVAAIEGWIIAAGTLDLVTSATNLGEFEWFFEFQPIDPGARVTVA